MTASVPDFAKIQAFWLEVEDTIPDLLDDPDESNVREVMRHYEKRLKSIDHNLTFHFERVEEQEYLEMVFGCDGYTQSIASVLSLVGAAPSIRGVNVKAFNHRHDNLPVAIRVDDEEFRQADFWFSSRLDKGEYHLSVFIKGLDQADENPAVEAAMIYLDAILGEFDLMTRVASLSWYPLPKTPLDHGLLPFLELRQRFDEVRDPQA